jgi:putative transcriptional regulator
MTDEEITAAAKSDTDNPPLTDEELAYLTTVMNVRSARERSGLTQEQFAHRYKIDLARLKDLELGVSIRREKALLAYLRVIEREPEAVARALGLDAA